MFVNAYEIASQFTYPVILSSRFSDGSVENGLGSFVIINSEGWIVTAAHMLNMLLEIQSPASQNTPTADKLPNPKKITHHSIWWGADQNRISQFHILKENDLALGKIENFTAKAGQVYPKFINPDNMKPGRSLCKLGFPFHEVNGTFNPQTGGFTLDKNSLPVPRFPIEGMYTRNAQTGKSPDGKYEYLFLETSSPGLRGQSGGPIFDKDGNIWAIQSQTRHLPLGFSPKVKKGDQEIEENQFLNVGWGVHVKTLLKFLDSFGVSYQMA